MTNEKQDLENKDIEKNKTEAFLSYFWIVSLYVYLTKKKSKFAQFHAKQGLILFFLSFATVVPFWGQLFGLVLLIVSIVGIMKAYNGEWYKIPVVYELSKKINF
ncbi:MAG: hypothetical protein PF572_03165 [Patescibacteria group bacterium]|jgi:uncharacterized membrane protein|nr:hypothetical protein [Patescibacteria group bacterium]